MDTCHALYPRARIDLLSTPVQLIVTAEEAFDYAKANCTADNPVSVDSFPNDLLP